MPRARCPALVLAGARARRHSPPSPIDMSPARVAHAQKFPRCTTTPIHQPAEQYTGEVVDIRYGYEQRSEAKELEFQVMNKIENVRQTAKISSLKVPALGKGVALLEAIAREPGLGFTAIQERLGMPKSSTHHLISTMCELGLIKRRSLGGYGLGLKLLELAGIAHESNDIQRDAVPILRGFAQQVQLTCHLGVFDDGEAVYLARVEGARDIIVKSHVGQRFPVNCSALGKCLVAWLPPEPLDAVIAKLAFEKRMPKTVMNAPDFRVALEEVRRRGWALDDEEQAPNCRCIAAPIRDRDGLVVAAISAVGTLEQVSDKRFGTLAAQIVAAASAISESVYSTAAQAAPPPRSRAARTRGNGR